MCLIKPLFLGECEENVMSCSVSGVVTNSSTFQGSVNCTGNTEWWLLVTSSNHYKLLLRNLNLDHFPEN